MRTNFASAMIYVVDDNLMGEALKIGQLKTKKETVREGLKYVHGYDSREMKRLQDQAGTLTELFHYDTVYPAGSRVLEAGCGIGAQTVTLVHHSPDASFLSVDISEDSIARAKNTVEAVGYDNVQFQQADIFNLDLEPGVVNHQSPGQPAV